MKHRHIIPIIVLLFCALIICSSAESTEKPVICGVQPKYRDEWMEILDTGKLNIEGIAGNPFDSLITTGKPDILSLSSSIDTITDYVSNDLLCSFKPSAKMAEELDGMPPVVQQALKKYIFTADGEEICGYPEDISILPMLFWVPDVWVDSPFNQVTPPSSFEGLLDFIELYVETPHEGYYFLDVEEGSSIQTDLFEMLINCWIIQRRNAGSDVIFSDPDFIAIANRTNGLCSKLSSIEPSKKQKKNCRPLFARHYSGYTPNGKDTFTWENLIPWRVYATELPLVNLTVELYCMSKSSRYSDFAADLFDCIIDHRGDQKANCLKYLYVNHDKVNVNTYNELVLREDGQKWKCLFLTQAYVDSVWDIHQYAEPTMVPNEFLTYEGVWEDHLQYFKLVKQFAGGIITAEDFAYKVDHLLD